jgi:hypothetical protein
MVERAFIRQSLLKMSLPINVLDYSMDATHLFRASSLLSSRPIPKANEKDSAISD